MSERDIVERLRDSLHFLQRKEAADEIERLRSALKTVLDREAATQARHDAKLDALEAEIERLREALRWYADQMCEFGPHYEGCGKLTDDDCAGCKARAALKERGDE